MDIQPGLVHLPSKQNVHFAPYTETFGYSDGSGSSLNPDLPDCWQVNNIQLTIKFVCG